MKRECDIKQHGDRTVCIACELEWDTNDAYPPECPEQKTTAGHPFGGSTKPFAGWEGQGVLSGRGGEKQLLSPDDLPPSTPLDEGVKFDTDKPRCDLLDAYALEELSKVLTSGAAKYAPDNWRKGISISRLLAASLRHIFALMRGEDVDPETGLSHASHAMCCMMFIIWTLKHKPEKDDRWKPK